jgi:alpha-L-rhamnosidase
LTGNTVTDRTRPHDLRVDHLVAPLGLGTDQPRLSWKLPAGATAQLAYQVVAGDWDSGRVETTESTFVPVDVTPASGLVVDWKVRTWTDLGESDWSATSSWEHGLLERGDWTVDWIAPVGPDDLPARQRPAV